MTKKNIQELFKKIGQIKVEYFASDHCACLTRQKIKEHVDRQIKERLINASISQKNTNFIIALVYDQASNDDSTQIARIHYLGTDLIQQLRKNPSFLLNVHGVRLDQSKKIKKIKEFLNDKKFNSIADYISSNNIEDVKRDIDNIYGVGEKLTNWSITNVTGNEYVVDRHIARVLKIVTNATLKQASKIRDKFKTQVDAIKIPSRYKGFHGSKQHNIYGFLEEIFVKKRSQGVENAF